MMQLLFFKAPAGLTNKKLIIARFYCDVFRNQKGISVQVLKWSIYRKNEDGVAEPALWTASAARRMLSREKTCLQAPFSWTNTHFQTQRQAWIPRLRCVYLFFSLFPSHAEANRHWCKGKRGKIFQKIFCYIVKHQDILYIYNVSNNYCTLKHPFSSLMTA